jgi:hypothetical protein
LHMVSILSTLWDFVRWTNSLNRLVFASGLYSQWPVFQVDAGVFDSVEERRTAQ